MELIYWQKTAAESWMNRSSNATTVAAHNSLILYLASLADIWARPDVVCPQGSTRLQYPKAVYHGAKPETGVDPNNQLLTVVGSFEPTQADWSKNNESFGSVIPSGFWFVAQEFVRELSEHNYATGSASRATGALFEEEEQDGYKFIDGVWQSAIIRNVAPETAINEPGPANYLRDWLVVAVPLTRAFVLAKRANSALEIASLLDQPAGFTTAQLEAASVAASRVRVVAEAHNKSTKIAAGVGIGAFILGWGIAAMIAKPPQNVSKLLLASGR